MMVPVIVPEAWLPGLPFGARGRDAAVLLSAMLLLAAGAAAPWVLTGPGEWLKPLHDLSHGGGSFQCPLCGGTRAFTACCSGDFAAAFAANSFAVMVFFWTAAQVPLRLAAFLPRISASARPICDRLERLGLSLFLPLMFACWFAGAGCRFFSAFFS